MVRLQTEYIYFQIYNELVIIVYLSRRLGQKNIWFGKKQVSQLECPFLYLIILRKYSNEKLSVMS